MLFQYFKVFFLFLIIRTSFAKSFTTMCTVSPRISCTTKMRQAFQYNFFNIFFILFRLHFDATKKHFHCLFVQWLLSLARVLHTLTQMLHMCVCLFSCVCVCCMCALAGFQCSNNCDCVNLNVSQVIFLHTTDARSLHAWGEGEVGEVCG